MQSLNHTDEQNLLDGVKQAVDLVDSQGLSPNAAMQKVAEEMKYSPGFVKAACSAFNNGRQLAQWNANDTVLDKLAGFPLADYDQVHDAMWGDSQEKVASAPPLGRPPIMGYADQERQAMLNADLTTFEKAAAEVEVHPSVADHQGEQRVKRAFDRVEWERRQVEEARREKSSSDDQLNLKVHLLESYFRKFSYDRLPLAQIEKAAAVYYGEPGKALIGYIASRFPQEKRACDHQPTWEGFHQVADRKSEPYTLVEDCIKQAQARNLATSQLAEAAEKLAAAEGDYQSFIQPRSSDNNGSPAILTPSLIEDVPGEKQATWPFKKKKTTERLAGKDPVTDGSDPNRWHYSGTGDGSDLENWAESTDEKGSTRDGDGDGKVNDGTPEEKQASILSGLAGGAGMGFTRNVADSIAGADDSAQRLESQINELESPDHQNELRKIRAQTVLTQLMSDPENPLSQHDPEEVLQAYNDMIQLSPRLADQPAAIGPLLNKKIMGETEPFEVAEQVKLEQGLKDVQAPQNSPPPAPSKSSTSKQVDLMKNEASILS